MKKLRNTKGITLIALVITIIILIILAGVSINIVFGNNGLVAKSRQGAVKHGEEADKEQLTLAYLEYQLDTIETEKMFINYLEEKGFDVEPSDENGKEGIVIINGKKYSFNEADGKLNIEYVGDATEEELNKPKFESLTSVVEGTTINVVATLKNPEGVTLSYAIKKETDENYGTEQSSSTFTNLQAGTKYLIKVTATNEGGQTTNRILGVKVLSLAELTQGKASFSISPNEQWQKEVTATITSEYTLGANEELRYRIGTTGNFIPYTGPFKVTENTSLYGIFYNTETEEIGYAFTLSDINVIDKEAPSVTVTESTKGSKTITVNVNATDSKIGMPTSPTYTYYITTDNTNYGSPAATDVSTNSYEFTGLTPNTTYYIKVTSKDKADNIGEGLATIKTETLILDSISMSGLTKTEYNVGESLDLSGVVVTATYTNGETENVTANVTFTPENGTVLTTAGDITLQASYQSKTCQNTITVKRAIGEIVPVGISDITGTHYTYNTDTNHGFSIELLWDNNTGWASTVCYNKAASCVLDLGSAHQITRFRLWRRFSRK